MPVAIDTREHSLHQARTHKAVPPLAISTAQSPTSASNGSPGTTTIRETHATASLSSSPTSPTSPATRHHSRSTTLTPRESLPPTLKTSRYTGEYLAELGGKGLEALFEKKAGGKGRKRRGELGAVFQG